jgi:hypothetical protein
MLKKILMASAMVAALGLGAQSAQAGVIQLGFILDRSGSIGSADWATITTGLSNAINLLVPINSTYEISVVSFATGTTTVVDHVLIDSAATRTAVAALIAADPYSGGSTYMGDAFAAMQASLTSSTLTDIDFSYVNIATDGVPNGGQDTATAVGNIIAAGIDNISIEAIGSGVDSSFLQNTVCYPQSCDTTSPFAFPGNGFYIYINDASEYADAIQQKIRVVTEQIPEPATLALMGFGLAGGAWLRRRRNQTAA